MKATKNVEAGITRLKLIVDRLPPAAYLIAIIGIALGVVMVFSGK